ncbi:replication protein [Serratia marcescens]|jgi:phage replication O-like protein O|uniref:replication protein n=1 Tax=Serratia marcescens TaxID=615 RepID=UPI0006692EC1|nr:replication protein [Serratia marcescens]
MSNTAEIIQFRAPVEREEHRVADLDDGFTRVANELLDAVLASGLTEIQLHIVLAVWRKTYGWNKKMDWISNEEFERMTTKDRTKCSTAKNQLIRMQVLVQKGRSVGMNKNICEWETKFNGFGKSFTESVKESFTESVKGSLPNQSNTKDTIQKTLKTDPPKAPKGEFSEEVLSQAKQALEYYNELTGGSCRSAEPFAVLLTETKTRSAYTLQDLQLVCRWVVRTWKQRNNTVAKPANICRVNRFDGYLSDAEAWQKTCVEIDCQAVVDIYNEITAGRMAPVELDREREISIRELTTHLATKSPEGFGAYFSAFLEDAREFYFGGPTGEGWHADFEYLMKPQTLRKVRERTL